MSRMILEMYHPAPADPAQNNYTDQSESEEQSVTSDIGEQMTHLCAVILDLVSLSNLCSDSDNILVRAPVLSDFLSVAPTEEVTSCCVQWRQQEAEVCSSL